MPKIASPPSTISTVLVVIGLMAGPPAILPNRMRKLTAVVSVWNAMAGHTLTDTVRSIVSSPRAEGHSPPTPVVFGSRKQTVMTLEAALR